MVQIYRRCAKPSTLFGIFERQRKYSRTGWFMLVSCQSERGAMTRTCDTVKSRNMNGMCIYIYIQAVISSRQQVCRTIDNATLMVLQVMVYSLDSGIFPLHYQVPFDPFSDTLWPFVIAARNAIAKATGNRTADAHVLGKSVATAAWHSYSPRFAWGTAWGGRPHRRFRQVRDRG